MGLASLCYLLLSLYLVGGFCQVSDVTKFVISLPVVLGGAARKRRSIDDTALLIRQARATCVNKYERSLCEDLYWASATSPKSGVCAETFMFDNCCGFCLELATLGEGKGNVEVHLPEPVSDKLLPISEKLKPINQNKLKANNSGGLFNRLKKWFEFV